MSVTLRGNSVKRTFGVILILALALPLFSAAKFAGKSVTVFSAGTKVPVNALVDLPVYWVMIQAKPTNKGKIYVVTSNDVRIELEAPTAGQPLPSYLIAPSSFAGEASTINLTEVYIDFAMDGDGANVHYLEKILK